MHLAQKMIAAAVASSLLAVGVVTACTPAAEQAAVDTSRTATVVDASAPTPAAAPAGLPADSGATTRVAGGAVAAELPAMTVYKSPTCGCCKGWVEHAQRAGFRVTVRDTNDVAPVKRAYGVDEKLYSCHTTVVGGYVVEGHVPLEDVKRLLAERPAVAGIAAPGMPVGSPGMEMGTQKDPYDVIAFTKDGKSSVYAKH